MSLISARLASSVARRIPNAATQVWGFLRSIKVFLLPKILMFLPVDMSNPTILT